MVVVKQNVITKLGTTFCNVLFWAIGINMQWWLEEWNVHS